jgi:predicted ArsR family transcriptional regulator
MTAARSPQEPAMSSKPKTKTARKRRAALAAPVRRSDSKQAKLIELLKRPEGATIDEIVKKFEWQPHTVRGAFAGALKKKLGLTVVSEKSESRGRVYRITH